MKLCTNYQNIDFVDVYYQLFVLYHDYKRFISEFQKYKFAPGTFH